MTFAFLLLIPIFFFGILIFIFGYRKAKSKWEKALLVGLFFAVMPYGMFHQHQSWETNVSNEDNERIINYQLTFEETLLKVPGISKNIRLRRLNEIKNQKYAYESIEKAKQDGLTYGEIGEISRNIVNLERLEKHE
jgi:hypothetical protein